MKPTIEVLKGMRTLLDDPKHWIKGTSQQKLKDGSYAYCVIGACDAIDDIMMPRDDVLGVLRDVTGWQGISNWNDSPYTTHADVISALDRAIGRLE